MNQNSSKYQESTINIQYHCTDFLFNQNLVLNKSWFNLSGHPSEQVNNQFELGRDSLIEFIKLALNMHDRSEQLLLSVDENWFPKSRNCNESIDERNQYR
jgi:uncharacterized UBP type Zn finger protein